MAVMVHLDTVVEDVTEITADPVLDGHDRDQEDVIGNIDIDHHPHIDDDRHPHTNENVDRDHNSNHLLGRFLALYLNVE